MPNEEVSETMCFPLETQLVDHKQLNKIGVLGQEGLKGLINQPRCG